MKALKNISEEGREGGNGEKNVISLKPLRPPLRLHSEEEHFEERNSVLMAEAVCVEIGNV